MDNNERNDTTDDKESSSSNHSSNALEDPLPKRRNLGRKARHRRKKQLEIRQALDAPAAPTVLPTDRQTPWPAVEKLFDLSLGQQESLTLQLGYLPGNAIAIVAQIMTIFPKCWPYNDDVESIIARVVLKLYPLVYRQEANGTKSRRKRRRHMESSKSIGSAANNMEDQDKKMPAKTTTDEASNQDATATTNTPSEVPSEPAPVVEPFPTLFWITHPKIKALISQLELNQRGVHYEKRLEKDTEALESMKKAHLSYGRQRYELLTEEDREYIQKRGWERALDPGRGVAGIRNFASVKCLHAHAAHYWSGCTDNVVGKWVSEEIEYVLTQESNGVSNVSHDEGTSSGSGGEQEDGGE